jgi:hypothetical protein
MDAMTRVTSAGTSAVNGTYNELVDIIMREHWRKERDRSAAARNDDKKNNANNDATNKAKPRFSRFLCGLSQYGDEDYDAAVAYYTRCLAEDAANERVRRRHKDEDASQRSVADGGDGAVDFYTAQRRRRAAFDADLKTDFDGRARDITMKRGAYTTQQ